MTNRAPLFAIAFANIGHTTMHVLAALYLTIVLGLERAWSMPYDQLIGLWTLGAVMIGLGAPLAGWLGDRWSESRMMVVFFLLTGSGAIAAGTVGGPTGLMIALATLGLGASIYHPVGLAWIVRNARRRGRAIGINGIFGGVGVATAALIAGTLTDAINWRAAFIIPGIFAIGAGIVLTVFIYRGWVVDRSTDVAGSAAPSRSAAIRTFLVLSVTMVVDGLVYNSLQTAMPKWFELSMTGLTGGGVLGVGGLVASVYLIGTVAQFGGGMLADRLPLRLVYAGGILLQVPLLAVASMLADVPLLITMIIAVLLGNSVIPTENLLMARYTPAKYRGLAYGLKFVLAFGVAPLAVQLVAVTFGIRGDFDLMLWLLAAAGFVGFLAATLLPRDGARTAPAAPVPAPVIAAAE